MNANEYIYIIQKMKKVSDKRKEQLVEYADIKYDMSKSDQRCVFTGLIIKTGCDFDIHHINGERENEHLVDRKYLFPCKRLYHNQYHDNSFNWLYRQEWYRGYLEFLKRGFPDLWDKEIYKPVRSGDMDMEWYFEQIEK